VVIPPTEELEILHRIAVQGSMREVGQRAAHLAGLDPRYGPFADQLLALARQFQSKAILNLIERHLHQGNPSDVRTCG
jgi:hypothetical protein